MCLEGSTSTRHYVEAFLEEEGVTVSPEFELATSDMLIQFALHRRAHDSKINPAIRKML